MLGESCKGKRRKGVQFLCKNRGPCLWLVFSAGLLKILLWQQLYWLFYEGLLKILALGFLSVRILRSNKEVAELPNREAVVKDFQQFTSVWDWHVDRRFDKALISSNHCPRVFMNSSLDNRQSAPNLLIFSSCVVLVPLFQCTQKRMARKGFCWCFKGSRNHGLESFYCQRYN